MKAEDKICCTCVHYVKRSDGEYICDLHGNYVGYVQCFTDTCENWEKEEMNEATDDTKTVITDIQTVDGKTHVPHLDDEKNLLLPFPWERQVLYYMIPRELIVEMVRQDFPIQRTVFAERGEDGKLHLNAPLFSPEELSRLFKEKGDKDEH